MNDVFDSWGVEAYTSPPQPVNERDIVSSPRAVYEAWYVLKGKYVRQSLTFNTQLNAEAWLTQKYLFHKGVK